MTGEAAAANAPRISQGFVLTVFMAFSSSAAASYSVASFQGNQAYFTGEAAAAAAVEQVARTHTVQFYQNLII